MTRIGLGALVGIAVGVVLGAALSTHAEGMTPDRATVALATQAGIDPVDLLGAANTTGLSPAEYLARVDSWTAEGELPAPVARPVAAPGCDWPICGPLGVRLFCIEERESHHNGNAVNPRSGAAGWLQWLPGTAARWGVQIGNRWSEWQAAARVAAQGERFFASQWVAVQGGC